jgi:hypothetical protein
MSRCTNQTIESHVDVEDEIIIESIDESDLKPMVEIQM